MNNRVTQKQLDYLNGLMKKMFIVGEMPKKMNKNMASARIQHLLDVQVNPKKKLLYTFKSQST